MSQEAPATWAASILYPLIETAARVPPHPVGIRQWRVDACGVAGDGSGEQAVEVAKQFHR